VKSAIRCALLVSSLLGSTAMAQSTQTFNDVPSNYWAFSFIEELAARGITSGCGGGSFCPESPITRAQMAVFLIRTIRDQMHHDFVALPGSAVLPLLTDDALMLYGDGSSYAAQNGTTTTVAPVLLPDGAEILGMECSVFDNDATGYFQIFLKRTDLHSPLPVPIQSISFTSTGATQTDTGYVVIADTADSGNNIVDNANYTYSLQVTFGDVSITTAMVFRGCSIQTRS